MSITSITWVLLAVSFLVLSLRRPVWSVAFYLQTFFAAPHMWWWGDEIPSARYALWAGFAMVVALAVSTVESKPNVPGFKRVRWVGVLMVLNAALVHLLLAVNRAISIDTLDELAKYTLLFFIMSAAIKDRADFHRVVAVIALGAAYIGWEVTINERGDFTGSRLEGVGAPAAQTANSLANVMLVSLPLAGSLLLQQSWQWKLVSLVAAPLILNVLLLCNSRGAFLGLVGTGIAMLLLARGATRKRALQVLALASVALFFLLGDPDILDRFLTTFVGSEQRDNSAQSRIGYWTAGLNLLNDRPLGAGGGAFKFILGVRYLAELEGVEDPEARSLHNGYLTEATDWGVQGLALKLTFLLLGIVTAYKVCEKCRREGRTQDALLGLCIVTTAVGFLIHCFFGSFLNNEWGFWTMALLMRYAALYSEAEAATETIRTEAGVRSAAA